MSWYDDNVGITDPEDMFLINNPEVQEDEPWGIELDYKQMYEELYQNPLYWIQGNGEAIMICKMETGHIRNCIRCIENKRIQNKKLRDKLPYLYKELQKRIHNRMTY